MVVRCCQTKVLRLVNSLNISTEIADFFSSDFDNIPDKKRLKKLSINLVSNFSLSSQLNLFRCYNSCNFSYFSYFSVLASPKDDSSHLFNQDIVFYLLTYITFTSWPVFVLIIFFVSLSSFCCLHRYFRFPVEKHCHFPL